MLKLERVLFYYNKQQTKAIMKKLLSILTLLLCVCSGAWAQDPTLSVEFTKSGSESKTDAYSRFIKNYSEEGIMLSAYASYSNSLPQTVTEMGGNETIDGVTYWFENKGAAGGSTAADMSCFVIQSSKAITKVAYYISGNTNDKNNATYDLTPVVLGWEETPSTAIEYGNWSVTKQVNQSRSTAQWYEYDFSATGKSLKDVRIYRQIKNNYTQDDSNVGTKGSNITLRIWAVKVWLQESGKAASSFALTSDESVTLWKGETSDITTSGNAGTVTYSNGGDDDVATVDSNGKITAVGEGTATITVTDPGDEDTDGRILYVSVTVNEHKNTTTTNEPAADDDVFVVSGNVASDKNSATNGDFTVKDYVGTAGNGLQTSTTDLTIGGNSYKAIKLASSRRFTVEALEGVTITSVKAYLTSQNSSTVAFSQRYNSDNTRSDVDAGDEETIPASGSAPIEIDLTKYYQYGFRFEGGTYAVFKITYTAPKHMAVTIKETGYATLFTDYAVAIPEDVKAYWGKLNDAKDEVQLTEITGTIPASTAVILKTETPGTYNFVAAEDVAAIENNILEGTLTDKVVAANSVYTLGLGTDGTVGMRQYSGTSVRAYSAYMEAPAGDARFYSLGFGDDDETTGVNNLSVVKVDISAPMYNLAGQRVRNDYKGIVVQKGKKFLNK